VTYAKVHLVILLAAIASSIAVCQEGSGTVQGSIRDTRSRPVASATISLLNAPAPVLTTRTDSEGRYRFATLRAGTYTLRAELSGYTATVFGPFVLAGAETKQVDLALAAAAEFFDEPHFIVAGVTDPNDRGSHSSEPVVRSADALARAAASLAKESSASASEKSLREAVGREPANADLHHSLGDVLEKQGNALEAVREYQRAAELSATENNLFDWGTELLTHRAADHAIEVFAKGDRLFPRSVRMLLGLGAALYAQGSYDDAARRLLEAVDLNPGDPAPYLFLGKVQIAEIAQSEGVLERFKRFATRHAGNALAKYYYAVSLWRRWTGPEDREIASQVETLLQEAVRIDPGLGDAWLQLGILYSGVSDLPKAISSYQKAIDTGIAREEAHYRLAQAYQRVGEKVKAREEFDLYEQLRKAAAAEEERRRSEVQQFVFALREH
jgi:tetratricopeptide (TPR) repeat protein